MYDNCSSGFSDEVGALGSELQQQLNFDLEQEYHKHVIPDVLKPTNKSINAPYSWEANVQEMHDEENSVSCPSSQQQEQLYMSAHTSAYPELSNWIASSTISFAPMNKPLHSMELFCDVGENSSLKLQHDPSQISFSVHHQQPQQPSCLGEIYHTLTQCSFQANPTNPSSYIGGNMEDPEQRQAEADQSCSQFANQILVDMKCDISKGDVRGHANHFATEKQRREYLNEKYQKLRTLVPNPTKADRASIVGDAIEYIKELLRTLEELKILVEQKRCSMGKSSSSSSNKRHKPNNNQEMETGPVTASTENTSSSVYGRTDDHSPKFLSNGILRSSWLKRTSKDGTTQVDVKIVDNEVNIKLVKKKCPRSCLLAVSLMLQELHLDLLHANGANIGEHHIFMFNTQIHEGSCQYARSIATRVMDAVDSTPVNAYSVSSSITHA